MLVNIEKLKSTKMAKATIDFTEQIQPDHRNYPELIPAGELSFHGQIENTGNYLQLTGKASLPLTLTCGRCLKQFEKTVEAEIVESYTNKPELAEQDLEDEITLFAGDEIDIMPAILKAIFFELPMHVLCQEDCQGLCPVCGADLNHGDCDCDRDDVDIRLLDLKKILKSMDKEV